MKELARREFGRRMEAARREADLTQTDIAVALKTTPATVSRWESGRLFPGKANFKKLCAFLRKSPEYFMGSPTPLSPTLQGLQEIIGKQEARIHQLETQLQEMREKLQQPAIPQEYLEILADTPPTPELLAQLRSAVKTGAPGAKPPLERARRTPRSG